MALSNKALQRKREKKKKKRSIKSFNLTATIIHNDWPIYECWMSTELWESGIGQVIVTRKNSQDDIAMGMYLIDIFCLGVKDCFILLTTLYDYQNILEHRKSWGEMKLVEPSYANTLINKSAEYAHQFGFKPQGDFSKAKQLLENIKIDDDLSFTFGKEGKPYYVQGPNESRSDVKRILRTLELKMGGGNYYFLAEYQPDLF